MAAATFGNKARSSPKSPSWEMGLTPKVILPEPQVLSYHPKPLSVLSTPSVSIAHLPSLKTLIFLHCNHRIREPPVLPELTSGKGLVLLLRPGYQGFWSFNEQKPREYWKQKCTHLWNILSLGKVIRRGPLITHCKESIPSLILKETLKSPSTCFRFQKSCFRQVECAALRCKQDSA